MGSGSADCWWRRRVLLVDQHAANLVGQAG